MEVWCRMQCSRYTYILFMGDCVNEGMCTRGTGECGMRVWGSRGITVSC